MWRTVVVEVAGGGTSVVSVVGFPASSDLVLPDVAWLVADWPGANWRFVLQVFGQ